jgi:hypothetical protein
MTSSTIEIRPSFKMVMRFFILLCLILPFIYLFHGLESFLVISPILAFVAVVLHRLSTWKILVSSEGLQIQRGMNRGLWTHLPPQFISWSEDPSYKIEKEYFLAVELESLLAGLTAWIWPARRFVLSSVQGIIFSADATSSGLDRLQNILDQKTGKVVAQR